MNTLTLRRPDDWHVHLRDGAMMKAVLPYTADTFGRAIVMPNLAVPVTTRADAVAYRERILRALPDGADFQPLMTAYLTDNTDPDDLARGAGDGVFAAAKLYPAGATTNSASGVTDIRHLDAVFERMEKLAMPLLIHGEVTDPKIDIFDREEVFIQRILIPLLQRFQGLKVVFEHITTSTAVDFVRSQAPRAGAAPRVGATSRVGATPRVGATITVHHLMINRTDLFQGGIRPHLYCLPVAKREQHRLALREAATSGEGQFFLGTDTAPHGVDAKQSACGCAGIFSAPAALELYAQVFDEEHALDRLEAFASLNGAAFYGVDAHSQTLTLSREPWTVPDAIAVDPNVNVTPFMAGETIPWRIMR